MYPSADCTYTCTNCKKEIDGFQDQPKKCPDCKAPMIPRPFIHEGPKTKSEIEIKY